MLATARLGSLIVTLAGLAAGIYLIAGSPGDEDFLTPRVLVALCGMGGLALVMYLFVLRPRTDAPTD
jgi:hypothetical protein